MVFHISCRTHRESLSSGCGRGRRTTLSRRLDKPLSENSKNVEVQDDRTKFMLESVFKFAELYSPLLSGFFTVGLKHENFIMQNEKPHAQVQMKIGNLKHVYS